MDTYSALERTVNKVLSQAESDVISKIDVAYDNALNKLVSSKDTVESDYNKIIDGAKKQAENLKRQMVGNSRLSVRNKQMCVLFFPSSPVGSCLLQFVLLQSKLSVGPERLKLSATTTKEL